MKASQVISVLLATLMGGCQSQPPPMPAAKTMTYNYDLEEAGNPHPSTQAQRERAKGQALGDKEYLDAVENGELRATPGPVYVHTSGDSIFREYKNIPAYRASTTRRLDSLQRLENTSSPR